MCGARTTSIPSQCTCVVDRENLRHLASVRLTCMKDHIAKTKAKTGARNSILKKLASTNISYSRRGHDEQKARLGWQIYRKCARQ